MSITDAAQKIVAELDTRNVNPYVSLAKAALWICAAVSLLVIGCGLTASIASGNVAQIGNVIGAVQALTVIALSVMGWHQYKGSRVLYLLRHWKDGDILNQVETKC